MFVWAPDAKGRMPGELRSMLEGQPPNVRRLFRKFVPKTEPNATGPAGFEEALGNIGADAILEEARRIAGGSAGKFRRAMDLIERGAPVSPEAPFLLFLHENLPAVMTERAPFGVIDAPETLADGTRLSILGREFAVIHGGDARLLVEQIADLDPDDPAFGLVGPLAFDVRAVGPIPVDKGSVTLPAPPPEPVIGQTEGVFGQRVIEPLTGRQGEMIFATERSPGPDVHAREGEDALIASKFDETATPSMFDEGVPPEPPPPPTAADDMPDLPEPGPRMATLEDVTEAIRGAERGHLRDALRSLVELSDTDAALMEQTADAMHLAFRAAADMAWATRTSAVAFLSPEQRQLLRLQKRFLDTEDSVVGASPMMPLAAVTDKVFGADDGVHLGLRARMGARRRELFGAPPSDVADAARHSAYMMGEGGRRRMYDRVTSARLAVGRIARAHGLEHREPELHIIAALLAREERQAQSGTKTLWHLTRMDGSPAAWVEALETAKREGLLSETLHPGVMDELRAYAREQLALLDDLRDIEQADELLALGAAREGYIPNVVTPTAQDYIAKTRSNDQGGGYAPLARAKGFGLEAFEKPRTTDSARFDSVRLGRRVEVFEGDRWVQTLSDADLEAIPNTDTRKVIRELREALDEYDAMPDRPPMHGNDPATLNELAKGGRFRMLLGSDEVPGGFFDTHLATIVASRLGQHERATARKLFAETVIGPSTIPVQAGVLQKSANAAIGSKIDLGNGLVGTFVPLPDGMAGVKIGDDVFRHLKPAVRSAVKNPFLDAMGDASLDAVYHQHVAEAIERVAEIQAAPNVWLKALDAFTGAWKTTTLFHPSWTIGNLVGDSLNLASQDPGFIPALAKYGAQAVKLIRYMAHPDRLSSVTFNVAGETVRGDELVNVLRDTPIIGAAFFGEKAARAVARDLSMIPSRLGSVTDAVRPSVLKADLTAMADHFAVAVGNSGPVAQVKAAGSVMNDRLQRMLVEPWFRLNSRLADTLRVVAYLSLRDQGSDHASAIHRAIRASFDYQDLAKGDRFARRLFPFWIWLSRNSVYQARLLLEKPAIASGYPKVAAAVEEAIAGEERVPMHARPQWMREALAVQVGGDPESRTGLLLGSLLPGEQAFALGRLGGMQDVARHLAGMMNPIVRVPFEIATGREAFSGRTIGDGADLSVGEHLAGQVRPLREIPRLAQTFSEQGAGAGAARVFLGGRAQSMSDERLYQSRRREFAGREDRLRAGLRRAERDGDRARSLLARAQLLRLYTDMTRAGHEADVPAWAREQVARLTGG